MRRERETNSLWRLSFQPFYHRERCCGVGGEGDVVHVANPHQGGNIRFMRLGGEWITKEEDSADFSLCHTAANDQVAAGGAVRDTFDFEIEFVSNQPAGAAGRNQRMCGKQVAMLADEIEQRGFQLIVGDEGDHC